MTIDLLVALSLVGFGFIGLRMGIMRQLAHWAGLILGRTVAKPLAMVMVFSLARDVGMPTIATRVAISAVCFYGLYVIGTIVARFMLKRLVSKDRKKTTLDRVIGFTMGLGQGAIVIWVFLSAFLFFERPLATHYFEGDAQSLRRSKILELTRRRNAFGAAPLAALTRLDRIMDAVREPGAQGGDDLDPELKEIMRDPSLREALEDDALAAAIKSGDWKTLQNDPRLSMLLGDSRLVGPMTDPLDYDW